MKYKVNEVSKLTGLSIRTIHYYDQIGLLKPDYINENGYRYYSDENLERLQQIMFFKELDFSLEQIKEILSSPNFDRVNALKMHKDLLQKKIKRIEKIIETVDKTINSIEGGSNMEKRDMFEAFDMSSIEEHQKKYQEETKRLYGSSDAYKESQKRTSRYSKEDWANIFTKSQQIYLKIADNMDKSPDSAIVQEAVHEWRELITNSFYNCTLEIFRGLGDLYILDVRFTNNIDKIKPGLANFLSQAIKIYCDNRHE